MLKAMDILMVGVGGQGTILASKILAHAAGLAGYDIKMSEIHGMAQRGGSVSTQVRLGEKIYSPLIAEGKADIILAFEKLEALRSFCNLKENGIMIVNDQAIAPVPVLAGLAQYPPEAREYIQSKLSGTMMVDALQIAEECGNPKAANVVLVGVLARRLPIAEDLWQKALADKVPAKFLEVNQAAFERGYHL